MNTKKTVLLLLVLIAIPCIAQEQDTLTSVSSKENLNEIQSITQESDAAPKAIYGCFFMRMPSVVNYNFKQDKLSFTPALMGGFGMGYKKVYFEVSSFLDKYDFIGFAGDLTYTILARNLDEKWGSSMCVIGEAAYWPAQQTLPELWVYTAGVAYLIYCPLKWGTPSVVFVVGGAYANKEISLNMRMMLSLAFPIF